MTTEVLTDEQRLETRRTLLQSIAEMQRGLTLAGMQLKKGLFSGAKDTITGTGAMLILHEGMAQLLLKENQRLREQLTEVRDVVDGRATVLHQTSTRMLEDGVKPKAERSPDYDHDVTMRYANYAAEARTTATLVNRILEES